MKKIALTIVTKFFIVMVAVASAYVASVLLFNNEVMAKQIDFDALLASYTDNYIQSDKEHSVTKHTMFDKKFSSSRNYIYEEPTIKSFSYMSWAIGFYKIDNDEDVDLFMKVNECPMYKEYFFDKPEWARIRKATREFLLKNLQDFPTRFEFMLPLMLKDYVDEKHSFEIQDSFKINGVKKIEVFANDFREPPCVKNSLIQNGSVRGLMLDFSRPFTLSYIPMSKEMAQRYIDDRISVVREKYGDRIERGSFSYNDVLAEHKAYLVLKVKIFAYGKSGYSSADKNRVKNLQVFSALEGFDIYDSVDKKTLLFSESYVVSQRTGELSEYLKSQYEILKRKHEGKGVFF